MIHRKRILRLGAAQGWICAGCGQPTRRLKRGERNDDDALTFDHVIPAIRGGHRALYNGLMKHRRCNRERGDRPASGCDLLWQAVVMAKLGLEEPVSAITPH